MDRYSAAGIDAVGRNGVVLERRAQCRVRIRQRVVDDRAALLRRRKHHVSCRVRSQISGAIDLKLLPAPTRCVDFSALKKKNSLSLTMRPPVLPPYCTTMFLGLSGVVWKRLRARSARWCRRPSRCRGMVGPRLDHDVDGGASGHSHFGRVGAGDDAHLLDRLGRRDVGRIGRQPDVLDGRAVNPGLVLPPRHAVGAERDRHAAGCRPSNWPRRFRPRCARSWHRERPASGCGSCAQASDERQFVDLLRGLGDVHVGAVGLERDRGRHDFDSFLDP